jgi:hypothetical protein
LKDWSVAGSPKRYIDPSQRGSTGRKTHTIAPAHSHPSMGFEY